MQRYAAIAGVTLSLTFSVQEWSRSVVVGHAERHIVRAARAFHDVANTPALAECDREETALAYRDRLGETT